MCCKIILRNFNPLPNPKFVKSKTNYLYYKLLVIRQAISGLKIENTDDGVASPSYIPYQRKYTGLCCVSKQLIRIF